MEAVDLHGNALTIEVAVTRGVGPVEHVDAIEIEEVVREGNPEVRQRTWLGPTGHCGDTIEIPVVLTVRGPGVDIGVPATLANDPTRAEPGWLEITHAIDLDADRLPSGLGEPVSGELRIVFLGGESTPGGRDGALYQLDASVLTAEGARETVLWYQGW